MSGKKKFPKLYQLLQELERDCDPEKAREAEDLAWDFLNEYAEEIAEAIWETPRGWVRYVFVTPDGRLEISDPLTLSSRPMDMSGHVATFESFDPIDLEGHYSCPIHANCFLSVWDPEVEKVGLSFPIPFGEEEEAKKKAEKLPPESHLGREFWIEYIAEEIVASYEPRFC